MQKAQNQVGNKYIDYILVILDNYKFSMFYG